MEINSSLQTNQLKVLMVITQNSLLLGHRTCYVTNLLFEMRTHIDHNISKRTTCRMTIERDFSLTR